MAYVSPDDDSSAGPLVEGWTAPVAFTASARSDDPSCRVDFVVVPQDGQVSVVDVHIRPTPGALLDRSHLRAIGKQIHVLLEDALLEEADLPGTPRRDRQGASWTNLQGVTWADLVELSKEDARRSVRASLRRRLTPDFFRDVVEAFELGGVREVQRRHGGDERTVRRWLARARKDGLR